MEDTEKLIQVIEAVRTDCPAPYIAIALEGTCKEVRRKIIAAGIRALALVSVQKIIDKNSPILASNLTGVQQTHHRLAEAISLHTDGYLSLLDPPISAQEGDSSLYCTQRLQEFVDIKPGETSVTRLSAEPTTSVYIGNLSTLVATQGNWAHHIADHCIAVYQNNRALARELAFSSLSILEENDPVRYKILCRLGKLGVDSNRLFTVYKIQEKMGVTLEQFLADISNLS